MWERAPAFNEGDRVKQVTGGPVMTVLEIYSPAFKYRYRCAWTGKDGGPEHELFRAEQIEKVPSEPKS